jgi:glycosyltransferase involved in cell wall biosynthesis
LIQLSPMDPINLAYRSPHMSTEREVSETSVTRPVILIVCDYYLPGYESGGAMRTLVNMVDRLGDDYDFRIITRDHDGILNRKSYTNVRISEWNRVGKADVYYLSKDNVGPSHLRKLTVDVAPDAIYLNSFFSPLTVFTLVQRKLNRIDQVPIILAPEGEFSSGALSISRVKKQLYIKSAKLLRLYDNIVWKAAAEAEREDIQRVLGLTPSILIAANMPPRMIFEDFELGDKPPKQKGAAKMVFLSRFMRKKNFNWLVPHLQDIKGELSIDLWGPLEDKEYWLEAQRLMESLPANIKIESKGPVAHDRVSETLAQYHYFILPTLGENFGHVYIEALAAGCPVITSDQTPWRGLQEKGVGWDLSLDEPHKWQTVINECLAMDAEEYRRQSNQARVFAVQWLSDPELETDNREVLEFACRPSRSSG